MKKLYQYIILFIVLTCFFQTLWAQEIKLTPLDLSSRKWFGSSVAILDQTAIVGAWLDNEQNLGNGAVYIYNKVGTSWVESQKLKISGKNQQDAFGCSVSLGIDDALVGASFDDSKGYNSGAVYDLVYSKLIGWTIQSKIIPIDNQMIDFFGEHLDMFKEYAIIGARGDDDVGENFGSAYIFHKTGNKWQQKAKFTPNSSSSRDYSFGGAVAIHDRFALVGSPEDFTNHFFNSGAVYVYQRKDSVWSYYGLILPDEAFERANFGVAVDIEGNRALVGSTGVKINGLATGGAYIFEFVNDNWLQTAVLSVPGAKKNDSNGFSVKLSGDNAFINGAERRGTFETGEIYWFRLEDGEWKFKKTISPHVSTNYDRFAYRGIDFSDNNLIVGALTDNLDSLHECGSAYIFELCGLFPEEFGLSKKDFVRLYPIPTTDKLYFDWPVACHATNAIVYNLLGEVIGDYTIQDHSLDVSNLATSCYIIQLLIDGKSYFYQFIKL